METKYEDRFEDNRFGFPVVVENVRMVNIRGEWVPDLNANEFRSAVLAALVCKPSSLTGQEVRFIRLAMEMTQADLAEELGVTHAAVSKWEAAEDSPTTMQMPTEFLLRFTLLTKLPIRELRISVVDTNGDERSTTVSSQEVHHLLEHLREDLQPKQEAPTPVQLDYSEISNPGVLRMPTRVGAL